MGRSVDRALFLMGLTSLTQAEVHEWAYELGYTQTDNPNADPMQLMKVGPSGHKA